MNLCKNFGGCKTQRIFHLLKLNLDSPSTTVGPKAALTSIKVGTTLLQCMRFTCDIHAKYFVCFSSGIEGNVCPYGADSKSLGRFGMDCASTLHGHFLLRET